MISLQERQTKINRLSTIEKVEIPKFLNPIKSLMNSNMNLQALTNALEVIKLQKEMIDITRVLMVDLEENQKHFDKRLDGVEKIMRKIQSNREVKE